MKRANRHYNAKHSWSTFLYKVLKQVHPDLGISIKAMAIMNDMTWFYFRQIIDNAYELIETQKKQTISSREVQTAVLLTLSGELAKHAVSEDKPNADQKKTQGGGQSRSYRAGLTFPVGRIHRFIKERIKCQIGSGVPVYLAAVLEYLTAEVLELAGNAAKEHVRILPRHIMLAVKNDEELNYSQRKCVFAASGIMPHIHPVLLNGDHEERESEFGSTTKSASTGTMAAFSPSTQTQIPNLGFGQNAVPVQPFIFGSAQPTLATTGSAQPNSAPTTATIFNANNLMLNPLYDVDALQQAVSGLSVNNNTSSTLSFVHGTNFRHEKTKKKRGKYTGGPLISGQSIRFDADELLNGSESDAKETPATTIKSKSVPKALFYSSVSSVSESDEDLF